MPAGKSYPKKSGGRTRKAAPPGAAKLDYTKTPSGVGLWKVTKPGSSRVVGEAKTEDSRITKPKNRAPKTRSGPR